MSTEETTPSRISETGVPIRSSDRDLEQVGPALAQWLRQRMPGAVDVTVTEVTLPSGSGVANETLLCSASITDNAGTRDRGLVIRLHAGEFLYPDMPFTVHHRMYEALADVDGVPVPEVIGYDADTSIFGKPFFVMGRIDGRVPGDTPPFHREGWVTELDTAEREAMWRNAVEVMARLHQVGTDRFSFLERPDRGATGLEQDLTYWREYHHGAVRGVAYPVIDETERWLVANLPANPPVGLNWGDSRVGNMIFDGGKVVALLDWDMVGLAGAESDLAWWTVMDYGGTDSVGTPRLPGIGSPADTIRLWQQLTGRDVPNMHWHLVFASYRMAVILVRLGHLLGERGLVPPEYSHEFISNNFGMQFLSTLLDLPPAGPITQPWPGLEL
jgi:aminoglycoside phosphotransferase (APT) family kinase protein